MSGWELLVPLRDILIQYYFGSDVLFYSTVIIGLLILFTVAGLDIRFSMALMLPLVAAFVLDGVFMQFGWILNFALLLVAVVYAYAIIKIFT